MEFLCYGTQQVGFQARVILDLWGMVFHAMVAFCLEVDFLLDFISACCDQTVGPDLLIFFNMAWQSQMAPELKFMKTTPNLSV